MYNTRCCKFYSGQSATNNSIAK